MTSILAVMLMAASLAAAVSYNLGIRNTNGEIMDWGTLSIDAENPAIVDFEPGSGLSPPMDGCLGVTNGNSFECQTMFRDIDAEKTRATLAYISPRGELIQAQLISGDRTTLKVEVPQILPNSALKRAGPQRSSQENTEPDSWRHIDKSEEVLEMEPSFLAKYWKYILPVAIIVLLNMFGPKAQQ